jgi:hypothetical protein
VKRIGAVVLVCRAVAVDDADDRRSAAAAVGDGAPPSLVVMVWCRPIVIVMAMDDQQHRW